jgi:dienelactone hydrolase
MKFLTVIFLFLITLQSIAQTKTPQDFGFRYIEFKYKTDKVDILVKSKKGDEEKPKPIFFFCQGSLPQPLIKYDEQGAYGVFPFNPDSLSSKHHIVIVSKPFIPLICDTKTLGNNFTYIDSSGQFPKKYLERNLLSYYVDRNIKIINYLQKQSWVAKKQLVLAGHSEGSTIVAKIASISPLVTHLIYSGGNPLGRIMSIIQQSRASETDSTRTGEQELAYWQTVVENKDQIDGALGDSYKTTYEFSYPPIEYLEKIKIPVLVCYGTKDWSSPFNDYLRVEMMRKGKKNFTFNAYLGNEHNYFPLNADNKPNYAIYNWDKVANDWLKWLNEK